MFISCLINQKARLILGGLFNLRARYCNCDLGIWHSLDPMANQRSGWSPYNYASCNPINRIDPTGMLDNGNQDESFWSRISRFLGFSGNNSHPENLGTQITESTVSGANEALNKKVKQAGKQLVETTAKIADATSDGSTVVAAGGVAAAPFTDGTSLVVTADALAVGTIADLVSLGAKTIDALAYDGSMDAVTDQAIKVGVNFGAGRLVNSAASKVVTRTGLSSTLFRSSSTGRFVSNSYGYTTEAVRDATKVIIGLGF